MVRKYAAANASATKKSSSWRQSRCFGAASVAFTFAMESDMQNDANPKYIVAYEVGFEGEINWDKPVVFNLAAIERIDKAEGGTARFFLSRSVTEPVEYVTRSSFDEVAERLGAIR